MASTCDEDFAAGDNSSASPLTAPARPTTDSLARRRAEPMDPFISNLARFILAGRSIDRTDAQQLASLADQKLYDLLYWANRIRIARYGPTVRFCSIVPASLGGCNQDCAFCAQSLRYRTPVGQPKVLTDEQILAAAAHAARNNAERFCIVAPGLAPRPKDLQRYLPLIRAIRQRHPLRVCASLGILTDRQVETLAQAGLQCYNHNLETSQRFFPRLITTHSFAQRLQTLHVVRQAGLELCSGGIFGVGETWADRIDLAFSLRPLQPQIIPLNFLHPIPGTPLANARPLPPLEILKIIAVFRFIFPDRQIKVAGGREVNLRDLQSWIFFAGASSIIVGNYLATTGRSPQQDLQMLRDLGLTCSDGNHPACPAATTTSQQTHPSPDNA